MPELDLLPLGWDPDARCFTPVGSGHRAWRALLLHGTATPETAALIGAMDLLTADPRVASVSVFRRDSDAGPAGQVGVGPAGPQLVIVNLEPADLIGDPRDPRGVVAAQGLSDWAAAALRRGFRHLWFVEGEQGPTYAPWPAWPDPHLPAEGDTLSPDHTFRARRDPGHPISIAVDGRWLGDHETGAQVAAIQLIAHLARHGGVSAIHVHDLPRGRFPAYADELRQGVKVRPSKERADVFWRPAQPDDQTRMWLDRTRGNRVVVTVLDLIEYSNPAYAADERIWTARRARTRRYLAQADVVTAISRDVLDHIAGELPGLDPRRMMVTPLGFGGSPPTRSGEVPPALAGLTRPFVLVLGNDYLHKNRDFAIRVWREVADRHEVDLVLAGLSVGAPQATTAALEGRLRGSHATLRDRVHVVPHVTAAEKQWLLSSAAVVHYPSSAEGFGLLPDEAAHAGVPCVFTRFGPLAERFPDVPNPATWSIAEHSGRISALLADPEERQRTVDRILSAGQSHTWEVAADRLLASFRAALALPPQPDTSWGRGARAGTAAARGVLALRAARAGASSVRDRLGGR